MRSDSDERTQIMASSDELPGPQPTPPGGGPFPGKPLSTESQVLDMGARLFQSMKPLKQMQQHVCTFAFYSHDMNRRIETHHYVTRLNNDFLQCAVYDSDDSNARLIGIEYIVSDRIFDALSPEEQKLWHSHAYEIKMGIWVNPGVPEVVQQPELRNLAKTYGKFWCTWQVDRGDVLPVGAPALMMSAQPANLGMVRPSQLGSRDDRYGVKSEELRLSRLELEEPEWINPHADYWKQTGKGFAIDVYQAEMKHRTPFP